MLIKISNFLLIWFLVYVDKTAVSERVFSYMVVQMVMF